MTGTERLARGRRTRRTSVGFLNRLPKDSRTAHTASHIRDLKIGARRERDEMRHVLDSLGSGFWDWDIPSLEVWYSSHAHSLLGYDADDTVWQTNIFRGLMHPDDVERVQRGQDALIYHGQDDYREEARVRHKDGRWVWVEVVGRVVVRASDGTALRIAGMFSGIDQRKQEQADSAFLLSLMQTLLGVEDPILIRDRILQRLGTYLQVGRVVYGTIGHGQDSIIVEAEWRGADIPQVLGEWSSPAVKPAIAYIRENRHAIFVNDVEASRSIDEQTRGLFRNSKAAAFIGVPLVIGDDVRAFLSVSQETPRIWTTREIDFVIQVAGRLWDSVLRARAEERSRTAKALLKLALRTGKIGARQKDYLTGEVTESENFYEVIGHPAASKMTVEEYLSHVHPEDRDGLRQRLAIPRHERGDEALSHEHRMITADEKIRHIVLTAQYHGPRRSGRKPSGYSTIFVQDVTEERQREILAASANSQLLKQSRLSAMGVMASTLAHELNQPLATAANYLSLINSLTEGGGTVHPDDVATYVRRALDKVLEAGELIRRIRNFTADGEIKATSQPLRDIVFRALSNMFGLAGSDRVAIINAVPRAITVLIEPMLIEHAVSNIVRNAVDALDGRTDGRIKISARVSGTTVVLEIADNGPGIPEDMVDNVFSPFVSNKPQGTGLGLPICRTMVEACGGKVELTSSGPDGTIFTLRLPASANTQDTDNDK